jgi:hypothetical protein
MSDWLNDNATFLYMFLGLIALVLSVIWWKTRQRKFALGAGVSTILLCAVFLLVLFSARLFGETDSQQIERKLNEMAQAVKAQDIERISMHISASFHFQSSDKSAFCNRANEDMRRGHVDEVVVWEVEVKDVSREKRTAKVHFMAKARSNWEQSKIPYRCRADFVLDPDDQWRLKGFELSNPYVETHQPIQVPGY